MRCFILAILVAIGLNVNGATKPTAEQIMYNASRQATKGSVDTFTVTYAGKSMNGSIKGCGTKFMLNLPVAATWYNGKYLWALNASSKETTIVIPTASELGESNPFSYLHSWKNAFNPTLVDSKNASTYNIRLTPKRKYQSVKYVDICLNKVDFKPIKITIADTSGKLSYIAIKSLKYVASLPASDFEYPKQKYPNVEIIDLR